MRSTGAVSVKATEADLSNIFVNGTAIASTLRLEFASEVRRSILGIEGSQITSFATIGGILNQTLAYVRRSRAGGIFVMGSSIYNSSVLLHDSDFTFLSDDGFYLLHRLRWIAVVWRVV